MTRRKNWPKAKTEVDETAATELLLYATNDYELYKGQIASIMTNLRRKIAKGTYDPSKAVKLWGYAVETAAKKYAREFSVGSDWHTMFDVPTRKAVAQAMAEHFEEELRM